MPQNRRRPPHIDANVCGAGVIDVRRSCERRPDRPCGSRRTNERMKARDQLRSGLRGLTLSVVLALAIGTLVAGPCWADETQQRCRNRSHVEPFGNLELRVQSQRHLVPCRTSKAAPRKEATGRRGQNWKRRRVCHADRFGSSQTGRPYLVKCGGDDPIESRVWLLEQLWNIRGEPSEATRQ